VYLSSQLIVMRQFETAPSNGRQSLDPIDRLLYALLLLERFQPGGCPLMSDLAEHQFDKDGPMPFDLRIGVIWR
jgi:hypothetical protein